MGPHTMPPHNIVDIDVESGIKWFLYTNIAYPIFIVKQDFGFEGARPFDLFKEYQNQHLNFRIIPKHFIRIKHIPFLNFFVT